MVEIATSYRLSNIVDDDGAVGIAVVHRSERFVTLLTSCVPDLKLYYRFLVE